MYDRDRRGRGGRGLVRVGDIPKSPTAKAAEAAGDVLKNTAKGGKGGFLRGAGRFFGGPWGAALFGLIGIAEALRAMDREVAGVNEDDAFNAIARGLEQVESPGAQMQRRLAAMGFQERQDQAARLGIMAREGPMGTPGDELSDILAGRQGDLAALSVGMPVTDPRLRLAQLRARMQMERGQG